MGERTLRHQDGLLYSDDDQPYAITYDKEVDIEMLFTPNSTHEGELTLETTDSWTSEHFVEARDLDYWLENENENWSEQNPLNVHYHVSTRFEDLKQQPLMDRNRLEKDLENLFGENYSSKTPEQITKVMREEFEFERNEVSGRDEFLERKVGQCDQFSELMSLANQEWLKHVGYSRQGDDNLPNEEQSFGNHAWVVDTEKQTIYDPTPVISHNLDENWVDRDTDVYFIRTPRIQVRIDGEEIPKEIKKLSDETTENYSVETYVEVIN